MDDTTTLIALFLLFVQSNDLSVCHLALCEKLRTRYERRMLRSCE